MRIPGTDIGSAARRVADHAREMVRLEIQLALAELREKLATIGVGLAFLLGAALFAFFLVAFLLALLTALLALVLPVWAALLIMSGIVLLLVLILAGAGVQAIKQATPVAPERAIAEANRTMEALRDV